MSQNKRKVATGGGDIVGSGYAWVGPENTVLATPATATSAIPGTALDLGYVSSDGLGQQTSRDSTQEYDWAGRPVKETSENDGEETFTVTLMQFFDVGTLSLIYGADNVEEDEDGNITATGRGFSGATRSFIFQLFDAEVGTSRLFVPAGKVRAPGDRTFVRGQVATVELTVAMLYDETAGFNHQWKHAPIVAA